MALGKNTENQTAHGRGTAELWLGCFIAVVLFFGTDAFLEFTTDTYATFIPGVGTKAGDMLTRNGRLVTAVYYKLFGMTGLRQEMFYYISFAAGVFLLTCAVFVLTVFLEGVFHSRRNAFVTSFLIVCNLFIIEFFMFVETMGFMTAVFCAVLSAVMTAQYLRGGHFMWLVPSLMMLMTAQLAYQPAAGIFAAILLPLVSFYAGGRIALFIRNNVVMGVQFGIVNVISILFMKHADSYRASFTMGSTLEHVRWAVLTVGSILRYAFFLFDGMLPNALFCIVTAALAAAACIKAAACSPDGKKLPAVLAVLYSMAALVILQIMYYAVGGQDAMRICYPAGALPGVAVMHFYLADAEIADTDAGIAEADTGSSKVRKGLYGLIPVIIAAVLVAGQYLAFQRTIIDRYKADQADKMWIESIGQAIEEYEEQSGTQVERIAFYSDAHVPECWTEFTSRRYARPRSLTRKWSDLRSINYYLGRNFKRTKSLDEYQQQFGTKDWNAFSRDQLIFAGKKLHLCLY